ncbi:MAG: hypothetical protein RL173_2588 [Fibrobacterota bacterium]|jgi:uncharacterized protein YbjT (DUF2867 family)
MTSISIVGATGLVGKQILLEAGRLQGRNRIRVWTRRPADLPIGSTGIVSHQAPSADSDFWQADVLFIALGTTIAKAGTRSAFRAIDFELVLECAKRARESQTRTLALVSASGADPASRIFYSRVKGEAEAALEALGFPRLVVARPSLLLGDRSERRAGEWLARKILGPSRALFPKSIRPVRDAEVARVLMDTAMDPSWQGRRILSNRELLKKATR